MRTKLSCLIFVVLTAAVGCNSSSSSPPAFAGSGTVTGGATAPGGTPGGSGPLLQKAIAFQSLMAKQHLPNGLAQDVTLDASGQVVARSGPSRCLWTGFYAASQAMRFQTTGEPDALQAMETSLWALHNLQEITGTPGVICRGFDEPRFQQGIQGSGRFSQFNYDRGSPSRDQYAGWFYGVGMCWNEIRDPALKAALETDVRAVCDSLMANNLVMKAPWDGQVRKFFNLNPDGINVDGVTAQSWAKIDDFPFNLLVKSVPYDPALVDAIKRVKLPPVRSGEALRALLMFTVAEHITKDPKYSAYKRDMLYGQRQFAQVIVKYGSLIDDMLEGRNLPVVRQTVEQLFNGVGTILAAYLKAKNRNILLQLLAPIVSQNLGKWLGSAAVRFLDFVHDPNNQGKIAKVAKDIRILSTVLRIAGQGKLADRIDSFMSTYGQRINRQGLLDAANALRSYLTVNLSLVPLSALVQLEPDPATADIYRRQIDRSWDSIGDEQNALVNLIHAGHGISSGPQDMPDAITALTLHPTDLSMKKQDNSNWPGLVVSQWPDRFGRVGNLASTPNFFPINTRSPDIFPWRAHPRQIVNGSDSPNNKVAPMGYLQAYWMGRRLGLISASQ